MLVIKILSRLCLFLIGEVKQDLQICRVKGEEGRVGGGQGWGGNGGDGRMETSMERRERREWKEVMEGKGSGESVIKKEREVRKSGEM